MVETITPVVHGGRGRWLGAVALHALGATATAALFGAGLGWVGARLGAPWGRTGILAVGAVALVYAVGRAPVPQLRRQVPDWWRTFFGRPVAALLYGAGLGVGFLTYLERGTLVAIAVAAVATGDPGAGALVLAPFGLVRGLSVLASWSSATPEAGRHLVDRLAGAPERARGIANGAALGAVAVSAAIASLRAVPTGSWPMAAAVLALAFGWAGASKLGPRWRVALADHRLPSWLARRARWAVPAAELLVPTSILLGRPRLGAALAVGLLLVFSLELVRVGRVGAVPCGCLGGRTTTPTRSALARNALLATAAVIVLVAGRDAPDVRWPGAPAPSDALPMLLATVGLGVAIVTALAGSRWLTRGRRA
jgi:hypothetical protein